MCYSEKLADQAVAYQTENGWVYVAWKAVAIHEDGEKVRPLFRPQIEHWSGETKPGVWGEYRPFGRLQRDRHGFHVAATKKGAALAALKFISYEDSDRKAETALQAWRRLNQRISDRDEVSYYRVRLVRCLVPSASVGTDEHIHSMILLGPGERETEELIALADRENKRLARKLDQREHDKQHALAALRDFVGAKEVVNG